MDALQRASIPFDLAQVRLSMGDVLGDKRGVHELRAFLKRTADDSSLKALESWLKQADADNASSIQTVRSCMESFLSSFEYLTFLKVYGGCAAAPWKSRFALARVGLGVIRTCAVAPTRHEAGSRARAGKPSCGICVFIVPCRKRQIAHFGTLLLTMPSQASDFVQDFLRCVRAYRVRLDNGIDASEDAQFIYQRFLSPQCSLPGCHLVCP